MPRTKRLKIDDETTVYHVMSRTALDGFPMGDIETLVKSSKADKSATLVFCEEFNGVKGFHAGPDQKIR